jgi:hypothetical protein
MPNIQVKLRRGTTAQHAGFTGAEGEVTVDTDKDTVVVHDGSTAGGHELRKKSDTIAGSEIDDNAVTSGKISDSDNTFKVSSTDVVVNEGGADVDFRVEGDTNANLIVADAGNDQVGLGGAIEAGYDVAVKGAGAPLIVEGDTTGGAAVVLKNKNTSGTGTVLGLLNSNTSTTQANQVNLDLSSINGRFVIGFPGATDTPSWWFQNDGMLVNKNNGFSLNGVFWSKGTGTPEGVVTAPVGSLFSRTDGGSGTVFYVKETGSGNTGWVAK